jgi:predicted phosphate transport protein (TIGR00153 family)
MLWRKQENVEQMMELYFDQCDRCFAEFEAAMSIFWIEGHCESFEAAVQATHAAESKADDMRRDIEYTLYGKALLPESRGDILGILETYDKLANAAETVCFALSTQQTVLPTELVPQYQSLIKTNIESYELARKAVDCLMSNPKATLHATKSIEAKESESDAIERTLIRAIFAGDWETGDKLVYKEIVLLLGDISDRAERIADRIGITAIKRQI